MPSNEAVRRKPREFLDEVIKSRNVAWLSQLSSTEQGKELSRLETTLEPCELNFVYEPTSPRSDYSTRANPRYSESEDDDDSDSSGDAWPAGELPPIDPSAYPDITVEEDDDSVSSFRGHGQPTGARLTIDPSAHPDIKTTVEEDDDSDSNLKGHAQPLGARLTIDPSAHPDMTVHMSLPAIFDVEDILEECSKLRRVGNFKRALDLYEDKLGRLLENRYIMVQYGQCLLEAGRHAKLAALLDLDGTSGTDILHLNQTLLLWATGVEKPSSSQLSSTANQIDALLSSSWPELNSTEIQIMVLFMAGLENLLPFYDWNSLRRYLVREQRIWEFHDVFVKLACTAGTTNTWQVFFKDMPFVNDKPLVEYLDFLHSEWETQTPDESTLFALLDLLTSMSFLYMKDEADKKYEARQCLERANKHAKKLSELSQENIKTRPFLRYMMATSLIHCSELRYPPKFSASYGKSKGQFLLPHGTFPADGLPIYIPANDEVPTAIRGLDYSTSEIIAKSQSVILAAIDLGDLELEAACLQEILFQGADNSQSIIDSLEKLWAGSGNVLQKQAIHLFQYAQVRTPQDRERLREELLLDGELAIDQLQYARSRILRALSITNRDKEYYSSRTEHRASYDRIRAEGVNFLWKKLWAGKSAGHFPKPRDFSRRVHFPYDESVERSDDHPVVYPARKPDSRKRNEKAPPRRILHSNYKPKEYSKPHSPANTETESDDSKEENEGTGLELVLRRKTVEDEAEEPMLRLLEEGPAENHVTDAFNADDEASGPESIIMTKMTERMIRPGSGFNFLGNLDSEKDLRAEHKSNDRAQSV